MKNQLDLIAQSSSRALESVREIALDLSPYHLEHLGLTATVQNMITRLTKASQIDVKFDF